MSGPRYSTRERKPSAVYLESKRDIETIQQRKMELEKQKQQIAAEALLLLNPVESTPISSVGVPHATSTNDIDVVTSKITDIINQLYGKDMVNEWKTSAKRARYGRNIYEISSATTQCMNTIGSADEAGGCWICGFAFDDDVPYMRPACDHILPVAQAVFFLGIYSTRKVMPTEQQLKNTIYKLEYAWAHAGCNILKSNINLITQTTDSVHNTPQWTVNIANIEAMLRAIQTTKTADLSGIQQQIKHPKQWFGFRKKEIAKQVEKITNFISRPEEPGLGNLTVLAGWASLVDPTNMTDDFLNFIHVDLPPNVIATIKRKRSISDTESPPPAKRSRLGGTRRKHRRHRKTRKNKDVK